MNQAAIKIGFTGHRDIRVKDEATIKEKIREKVQQLLQEFPGVPLEIIAGNAAGADTLLLQVLAELNDSGISRLDIDKLVKRSITKNKKGEEEQEANDSYYKRQAAYIVGHSTMIIAAWNGIFNHKPGGTADIVRMALEKNITVHHLVSPRVSNSVPVNSLASNAIDYDAKQFTRIPFTVNFSWHTVIPAAKEAAPKQSVYDEYTRPLLFNYVIPIGLALLTLVFGWVGFNEFNPAPKSFLNNLFDAANLITLNSSKIGGESNAALDIARILGLLTLIYAFGYGLSLAFGRHRQNFTRRRWKNKGFVLVLGLNEKSMSLIKSLVGKQQRVILLTEHEDSIYENELKKLKKLITVRGSLSSATMLEHVYAVAAKEVYILSDNDSKNVRAAQELDILLKQEPRAPGIFVHLLNEDYSKFLRDSLSHIGNHTTIFNIYENIARRLFLHFPPDRFYQSPQANILHAIIIGFDDMGKELLLNLLKQGHYQQDKKMKITVYCSNAEDCQNKFENQHPLVIKKDTDTPPLKEIKDEVWQNVSLSFVELPQSDAAWLDDKQALYKDLDEKHIVTVYVGLDNGIAAVSYLNCLLPRLNYRKKETRCDIQVFCYYNFPDRKEEAHIEAYLNSLAPELFVKCFGNFVDECGIDAVKSMALDEMAKLINVFYAKPNLFKTPIDNWEVVSEAKMNESWASSSAKDRMSSQQAGDHVWVKLRILHMLNGWDADTLQCTLIKEPELLVLAETEHRRWGAELLLQGFVPFTCAADGREYAGYVNKWNSEEKNDSGKTFKQEAQLTKRHINLVPFKKLAITESDKDYNQVNALPYFLKQVLPAVFEKVKNKKQ